MNDQVTEQERKFNDKYIEMLEGYADGKVDGVKIKNLTAGAAVLAKKQQSRSAMAALRYAMTQKDLPHSKPAIENNKDGKQ